MSARNTSQRAEQRKLREQMRGLGMSRAEIAAEMARRYRLRPRTAWRTAWGWTLEEAAERFNAVRARDAGDAVTSLIGSRLSEWENWPLSTRKPSVTGLCVLAEVYQCGVLDLIDFHDREKFPAPNCSHSANWDCPGLSEGQPRPAGKCAGIPRPGQIRHSPRPCRRVNRVCDIGGPRRATRGAHTEFQVRSGAGVPAGWPAACPGAVRRTVHGVCGPVVGQI